MMAIIEINNVTKTYHNGLLALKPTSLSIEKNEIFALLGPNGAGKTTLIGLVCGLINLSSGTVSVDGHDHIRAAKYVRQQIGLVPQELTTDMFETVWNTVTLSRGLFGLSPNPDYINTLLKTVSLHDKKSAQLRQLSGGMKRRVMIAKALSHEPSILFLDEPTAGVDVELRKEMWDTVRQLRDSGVTVILTTHYIEEAEDMADRIGIIRQGELILVEEKSSLIKKLGKKTMDIELSSPLQALPDSLKNHALQLNNQILSYTYDSKKEHNRISIIFDLLKQEGIYYLDFQTMQFRLEEIFVALVNQ
ncbi:MAG: ABC transporter ATP-binding protein [Candidatus Margulisiibacteriota bacterium]